jgi:DNA invertase Pin-like site-specific DNA recombinase
MKRLYARVSTLDQELESQIDALKKYAGEDEYVLYHEKLTGKDTNRPELRKMMKELQKGDMVVVIKLDRLARSLYDLQTITKFIEDKGCTFVSLGDPGIDTSTPNGKLLFQVMGAFAEFERALINKRMEEGRRYAKLKGVRMGRPELKTGKKNGSRYLDKNQIIRLHKEGKSANQIRKELGCSINPVLRIIHESEDKELPF